MEFEATNDAVASERSIFSENHDYKSFSLVKNKWVELASNRQ